MALQQLAGSCFFNGLLARAARPPRAEVVADEVAQEVGRVGVRSPPQHAQRLVDEVATDAGQVLDELVEAPVELAQVTAARLEPVGRGATGAAIALLSAQIAEDLRR